MKQFTVTVPKQAKPHPSDTVRNLYDNLFKTHFNNCKQIFDIKIFYMLDQKISKPAWSADTWPVYSYIRNLRDFL